MVKLKGITWNHSRGYTSIVATSQRFMEINPNVEITWDKRSLQEFADYPIDELAEKYDLLVIDHPWAGFAADKGILLRLEKYLPKSYLQDQAENSVGKSFESYNFDGYQSALVIDAAAPVATYRPDLFEKENRPLPKTWEDLIELAKEKKVVYAGYPINNLMEFYMMCRTQDGYLFNGSEVVNQELGIQVLEQLRELASYCTDEMFDWEPISVYEAMSTRDDLFYCPFAYGYSNYSREGYAKNLLISTDLIELNGKKLISTLGGTGLAISNNCKKLDKAIDFVKYAASPDIQRTLYFENGGQPGHRKAWLDTEVNRRTHHFFKATLPALDRAYLRPRYSGYFHFQDHAGDLIRDYVRYGGKPDKVMDQLNNFYQESLQGERV
ncbi:extracellular solute-binding protein [Pullulanibacillus sp. KACC 23026]|uniref:ABC transporter substrate-binding protein n=1 Tax=Pullulanibacillus sp. KACC 23026 TaxID=3028315 RepID=UPI0023AF48AD|nr:extracellular solute-binding protein [Pullulanibacillus sp. KACC 23026]WEG11732.1 extracellular solute-binding protein [Pullulanibacillus sp. KACC 23026]